MRLLFLSRNYKGLDSAGNKAKTDIERIMESMNFQNAGLHRTVYKGTLPHFFLTLLGVIISTIRLRKGDILVLQYPLKKYFSLVCRIAHLRGAKTIIQIHDLGSFRRKALTVDKEIRRLNHANYIIAHNESMKKWLLNNGCKPLLGTIGIFDYLSDSKPTNSMQLSKPYIIIYAGALNPRKNSFLYDWGEHINQYCVKLYGNGFELSKAKGKDKFKPMGFIKSDDMISSAQGHFGLVWDGESIDCCSGDFGTYLEINNPHKTSLYIRCCLPIIIWEKAALAKFVQDHRIGICVNSLRELDKRLNNITPKQYQTMKENICTLSEQLADGFFFKNAVNKGVNRLK